MINILNKTLVFLTFLFQVQTIHTQIYTNNQQYLNDPHKGFQRTRDLMKKKENLTIKTNVLYFKNENGKHLVSFSFSKDNSTALSNIQTEIFVRINTKIMITPFDGFDQMVTLSILGWDKQERWKEEFYFNKRQAYLEFLKTGEIQLDLVKILPPKTSQKIQDIFQNNKDIYFQIEGIQGRYDFVWTEPIIKFYRQLFDYKDTIYKKRGTS